ncbi:MAG: N-6 DNA methylase, partial [Elusimicrobiota bacterium]|nr:N-6 DNA methylase [Elusimicrobiota bacterium]
MKYKTLKEKVSDGDEMKNAVIRETISEQINLHQTNNFLFPFDRSLAIKHKNRKNHNQYFTPEFAVKKALSLIPTIDVKNIIDPAVGEGVFLKVAKSKWQDARTLGVDIDKKIISGLNKSNFSNSCFYSENSLVQKTLQISEIQKVLSSGGFDLIVGNPPFSSWFNKINDATILSNYELAKRNSHIIKSQAIEVLFIEKFIQLCKKDGYIVIVLPDGILSNPKDLYIREFILRGTVVKNIISLPRNVFENTSAKTSILILQKKKLHNSNYVTKINDLGKTGIVNNTIEISGKNLLKRMDYWYYHNLKESSINKIVNSGVPFRPLKDFDVYCKTGKTLYGKERKFSDRGLRFLHATNITEVGIDYKKDEKFIEPSSKMNFPDAHTKVGDIVFVRVGVGCAGRVAVIDSKNDEGVASDYLHILRVKKINPYYLVMYLKTKFGKDSINLLKHGVGTVSINKKDLLSIMIPIVSETIQAEVEKRYKNILAEHR